MTERDLVPGGKPLPRDLHQWSVERGDVDSLEVKPDSQKISITSERKGSYGQQPRENYRIPKPATVSIKASEIPPAPPSWGWRAPSIRGRAPSPTWPSPYQQLPSGPSLAKLFWPRPG